MRKSRQNKYTGLFYVLPFVIGLLVFQLYPFLASFFYSFTDLSIANDWSWVGLSNYIKSFTADRDFWNSLKVTGIYVFIAVPCKLVFALFIAMVLNMKIRGIRFFQTLYYIPSILGGSVAVSVIWRFMFSHDGLVNTLTSYLGLPALDWLGSKALALPTSACWPYGSSVPRWFCSSWVSSRSPFPFMKLRPSTVLPRCTSFSKLRFPCSRRPCCST